MSDSEQLTAFQELSAAIDNFEQEIVKAVTPFMEGILRAATREESK